MSFILCTCLSAQQTAEPLKETQAQGGAFTIESKVNVALVPVLVRDAQGRAVGELNRTDFKIFDNNKPQVITGFSIQKRAERASDTNATQAAASISTVTPRPPNTPDRFIVFLFDDMHLTAGDLVQAQRASAKMLSGSLTDSDMAAVVSMSGRINSGLTHDRSQLQEAIAKMQPQGLYRSAAQECPNLDYFQADLIANKHNSAALEAAIDEMFSCAPALQMRNMAERMVESAATRVVAIGEQDVRVALATVREFVQKMAGLPGQHTLILVSPGFLILTPETRSEESRIMDIAAQSNVTISALDARGLYTTEIDASEMIKGSAQTSQLKSEYRRSSMSLDENVMAELADGTGGTYFHNSNDLEGGFNRLTAAPEYLYVLEFSLKNVKQNGSYHRLKVEVDHEGLRVQARRGYFAPKPAKGEKR